MGKVTQKLNKIIISGLILAALFPSALIFSATAHAASIQASATSVTIGETFTISVQFQAAAWDVQFYTTGPTNDCSLHDVDVTLDGMSTNKTLSRTCVASGAGTVTAILSGTVSDANGNETPISGNTSIMVMTAPDPTPAKPSIPEDTVVPPALTPEPAEATNTASEGTSEKDLEEEKSQDDETADDEEDNYKAPLSATTVNRRSSGGSSDGSNHTFTTLTTQSSTDTGPSGLFIAILVIGILITIGNLVAFVILKKRKGTKAKKPLANSKNKPVNGKTTPKTTNRSNVSRNTIPTYNTHKHITIPAPSTIRVSKVPAYTAIQSQVNATQKTVTSPNSAAAMSSQALGYASYHEPTPEPVQQEIARRLARTYSPMPTFGAPQSQRTTTSPQPTNWESPARLIPEPQRIPQRTVASPKPQTQMVTVPSVKTTNLSKSSALNVSLGQTRNVASSTKNVNVLSSLNTPSYGNLSASHKNQTKKQKANKPTLKPTQLFQSLKTNLSQVFEKVNPLPLVHGLRHEAPAVVSSPVELNPEMLDEFRNLMNS